MAAKIVWEIRSRNGRFLKLDASTGMWYEIGDKAAFRKTGQALREGSAVYREAYARPLESDDEDDGSDCGHHDEEVRDEEGRDDGSTCIEKKASV